MVQHKKNSVVFLCSGNYISGRCTEALFNAVAVKMGLPWAASCRMCTVDGKLKKLERMSPAVTNVLNSMSLHITEGLAVPSQLAADDLKKADRIIAMNQAEHRPLLEEQFPAWADKVEYWEIDDSPEALTRIGHEVMDLAERCIRGGERQKAPPQEICPKCRQSVGSCTCSKKKEVSRNITVRVGRETKGRRGKGVTTISDLQLDEIGLTELAGKLKQRLGTGGTTKDGRIEIQGDQRDRLVTELEGMGYRVKRVG
jgi:translation initiation factor 1